MLLCLTAILSSREDPKEENSSRNVSFFIITTTLTYVKQTDKRPLRKKKNVKPPSHLIPFHSPKTKKKHERKRPKKQKEELERIGMKNGGEGGNKRIRSERVAWGAPRRKEVKRKENRERGRER